MAFRMTVVMVGLAASTARADHREMAMNAASDTTPPFDARVSLVAASYATISYVGDYEGAIPSLEWTHDRYMIGASVGLYRILLNGLEQHGIGDLTVHAAAMLVQRPTLHGGAMLMASAPTAVDRFGLGMGHPMVMPSAFAAWTHDRFTITASAGFSRALAQMEVGHDHGVWPLVEPMNMSEITWSAGGALALGGGIRGGAHIGGGIPVGLAGHDRVIGGLRLAWGAQRVDTAAELQIGLVGDPFTVRGLVETALHF